MNISTYITGGIITMCIVKMVQEEVKRRCESESNYFGTGLFYLAVVQKGLTRNEGVKFVRNKILRSYNKMSEKSKEYYKSKKEAAELLLI